MAIIHALWDDRGDELEAHCELIEPGSFTWQVRVISLKGNRGAFRIRVPPGIDSRSFIGREVQLRGIHATNKAE